MGRSPRPKPARLGEKLLAIRLSIGFSQTQMLKALDLELDHSAVSGYELGTREPPLPVLLKYARLAGVWADVLIDDELDLPERLPSPIKHEGIKRHRKSTTPRRRKR